MKIGQVIKALRLERELSQESLALEVDTATSNLSRIEKNERTPSFDLLCRLATALQIPLSGLLLAAEGGDLPKPVKTKHRIQEDIPDYADDLVLLRKLYRDLSPNSRIIALEILKTLKRTDSNERAVS